MVPAHRGSEIGQSRHVGNDPFTDDGMLPQVRHFLGGQRARFAENAVTDADLADVVQQSSEVEVADLTARQIHHLTKANGNAGDAFAVTASVRVLGVDCCRKTADDPEQSFLQILVEEKREAWCPSSNSRMNRSSAIHGEFRSSVLPTGNTSRVQSARVRSCMTRFSFRR